MTNKQNWRRSATCRIAVGALPLGLLFTSAVMGAFAQQKSTYTFTVLHRFKGGADGANPYAGVILDSEGNLYGTTVNGGASGLGVVFKVDKAGHETVLHAFSGRPDGANPYGALVLDTAGNLYGTTNIGGNGAFGAGDGTVFEVDTTGTETVLHGFTNLAGEGAFPVAGLTLDSAGNFLGTTECGGKWNVGAVFQMSATGTEEPLFTFDKSDGLYPWAGVTLDPAGYIYGTTSGTNPSLCSSRTGKGVVFELDPATRTETVLHSFTGGADGQWPYGALAQDSAGNLYGTASAGGSTPGSTGYGVVYQLDTTGTQSVLYTFTGGADGATPWAGPYLDAKGKLYGTTFYGGAAQGPAGYGLVYQVDASSGETVLYTFTGGADGANPYAGLVEDSAGNLYGTTYYGGIAAGSAGYGVVFKLTPQD